MAGEDQGTDKGRASRASENEEAAHRTMLSEEADHRPSISLAVEQPSKDWRPDSRRHRFFQCLQRFLDGGHEGDFIVFSAVHDDDSYVQYRILVEGVIAAEIGSHEWGTGRKPLSGEAQELLAGYGFGGGGPDQNYRRELLPPDPHYLAALASGGFLAYDIAEDFGVTVKSTVAAVDDHTAPAK